MYSFMVKRYVYTSLVKQEIPIMSTICYLGPRFSEFNTPNSTHVDAHKIYDLGFVNF